MGLLSVWERDCIASVYRLSPSSGVSVGSRSSLSNGSVMGHQREQWKSSDRHKRAFIDFSGVPQVTVRQGWDGSLLSLSFSLSLHLELPLLCGPLYPNLSHIYKICICVWIVCLKEHLLWILLNLVECWTKEITFSVSIGGGGVGCHTFYTVIISHGRCIFESQL